MRTSNRKADRLRTRLKKRSGRSCFNPPSVADFLARNFDRRARSGTMSDSSPHNPPFRAEHVGSLLRPPELLKARAEHEAGRLPAAELHNLEDQMIRKAVAFQ